MFETELWQALGESESGGGWPLWPGHPDTGRNQQQTASSPPAAARNQDRRKGVNTCCIVGRCCASCRVPLSMNVVGW